MKQPAEMEDLLEEGFTLEVCRYADTPLHPGDRVLAREEEPCFVVIARAPLLTGPGQADTLSTDYQPALAEGLRT